MSWFSQLCTALRRTWIPRPRASILKDCWTYACQGSRRRECLANVDSSPAGPHNPKACGTYACQGSRRYALNSACVESSPAGPQHPKACGTYACQGSRRREFDRITWIPRPRARTARRRAGLTRVRVPVALRVIGFRGFLARGPAQPGGVRGLRVSRFPSPCMRSPVVCRG